MCCDEGEEDILERTGNMHETLEEMCADQSEEAWSSYEEVTE